MHSSHARRLGGKSFGAPMRPLGRRPCVIGGIPQQDHHAVLGRQLAARRLERGPAEFVKVPSERHQGFIPAVNAGEPRLPVERPQERQDESRRSARIWLTRCRETPATRAMSDMVSPAA